MRSVLARLRRRTLVTVVLLFRINIRRFPRQRIYEDVQISWVGSRRRGVAFRNGKFLLVATPKLRKKGTGESRLTGTLRIDGTNKYNAALRYTLRLMCAIVDRNLTERVPSKYADTYLTHETKIHTDEFTTIHKSLLVPNYTPYLSLPSAR